MRRSIFSDLTDSKVKSNRFCQTLLWGVLPQIFEPTPQLQNIFVKIQYKRCQILFKPCWIFNFWLFTTKLEFLLGSLPWNHKRQHHYQQIPKSRETTLPVRTQDNIKCIVQIGTKDVSLDCVFFFHRTGQKRSGMLTSLLYLEKNRLLDKAGTKYFIWQHNPLNTKIH